MTRKQMSYMPAKIKVNESMTDYAIRLQEALDDFEPQEGDFCRIERHPKVGQVLIKKINDSESDDPEMSIEFVTPDFIRLTLEISCRSEEGRDQLFEEMTGEKLITRIESVTGELGL